MSLKELHYLKVHNILEIGVCVDRVEMAIYLLPLEENCIRSQGIPSKICSIGIGLGNRHF